MGFGAWSLSCLLPLVWLQLSASALAQTPSREYQVKAVYLVRFSQFTQWPAEAFTNAQAPLVIGVLGTDPFGSYLDEAAREAPKPARPLMVERYRRVAEIKTCHILYIGQSEARRLEEELEGLKGKPVLTVSGIEGAAERGVVVAFVPERNTIRFRINVEAAKEAGLNLSPKLKQLAERVGEDKK